MLDYISKNVLRVIVGVIVLTAIIILFSNINVINSGEAGLVQRFGVYKDQILNEGLHIKTPFIEKIEKVDCKIQKGEQEFDGATKDLQDVSIYVIYNYKINKDKAVDIYKNIGRDWEKIIVEPIINNVTKTITSEYTSEELITRRKEYTEKILYELNEKLNVNGVEITEFTATNINFSEAYNQAIEKKQIAQQEVLKSQQELEKIKIEAEQKVVQAKAEAEALKIQNQEVTDKVLELRKIETEQKAIEKWNGQLPSTQLGDTIPFISLSK